MEKEARQVVVSDLFESELARVYEYGIETFGRRAADSFLDEVITDIESLTIHFLIHPECRPLRTKGKIYRNIIIGRSLVVYRITSQRIEVLSIIHGSRSPSLVRKVRDRSL
jgi:plasmid stabilization system protein ParE